MHPPHFETSTLQVMAVLFIATLVQSTFGFGAALVAMPLLALLIPLHVATPLVVLTSGTVSALVIAQDWRHVHARSTGWLLAPTLLGIPVGLALLTCVHQNIVKAMLAMVIVAFSAYSLLGKQPPELRSDNRPCLLGCGFAAGVLGTAYGMNGPPLIIYGSMRRWSPQHFRATLQGYFLPAGALSMAGYWCAGLWVPAVTHLYLVSLLVAVPATLAGRVLNGRLREDGFVKYVHCGLVCVGMLLLVQAFRQA